MPCPSCFRKFLIPLSRKQLQFSLLNAQDTVKISEFQVTHRDLYTATDRVPVKDGVLDRRLVSLHHDLPLLFHTEDIWPGYYREKCILRDMWALLS